ncbi:hypothetical protein M9Y10_043209 [Tritrichomonas musculus]|uniref:Surface antigen BspA-like n=1 Tax=Tritrichomonas musculus TaxID=1915356 RepID=A0ABR2JZ27_9EUKA
MNCQDIDGELQILADLKTISDMTFCYCHSLKGNISLPKTVASIGVWSFRFCLEITGINFPDILESIGAAAFERCQKITKLTFPESLKKIEMRAFLFCF